jgi:hypothetical protein
VVLREAKEGHWTWIGGCFSWGIMNGEALDEEGLWLHKVRAFALH